MRAEVADHGAQRSRNEHADPVAEVCLGVTSDKTHVEHNEPALTLIADMPGDMDFRCNGPKADMLTTKVAPLGISNHTAWANSRHRMLV